MKPIYTPALIQHFNGLVTKGVKYIPSSVGIFERSRLQHEGYKLSWWENDSFYRYDAMLISAYYGAEFKDFRKEFRIDEKTWVLADSGGFQNITRETNLTPEKVLRWAETNAQASLTLDYPPVEKISSNVSSVYVSVDRNEMLRRLKKNAEAGKEMLEKRKRDDLELIFITHGESVDDMDRAIGNLKDVGLSLEDFDGESKVLKNNDLLTICTQLLHTVENCPKNKRFHFLGLSGLASSAILFYTMHYYRPDLKVTFDSSSYGAEGAIRRRYWIMDTRNVISFSNEEEGCHIAYLPCDCPVCSIVQETKHMKASGSIPGGLISLHNLFIYLRYVHTLSNLVPDKEAFKDFANRLTGGKTRDSFDFIDMAMEKGIQRANAKFGRQVRSIKKKETGKCGLDYLMG
jgi:tRNA-guanine family transglycosylase